MKIALYNRFHFHLVLFVYQKAVLSPVLSPRFACVAVT